MSQYFDQLVSLSHSAEGRQFNLNQVAYLVYWYCCDEYALLTLLLIVALVALLTLSLVRKSLSYCIPIVATLAIILTIAGFICVWNLDISINTHTMNRKIMPIASIQPDRLPMTDGTWRHWLERHDAGMELHNIMSITIVNLHPTVDISKMVAERLRALQQKGEYEAVITTVKTVSRKHRPVLPHCLDQLLY
jgi:hypothetical protein